LAISYRLNYLDRHYQYTPALPAYQFPDLSKGVGDRFVEIEQEAGLLARAMLLAWATHQKSYNCR